MTSKAAGFQPVLLIALKGGAARSSSRELGLVAPNDPRSCRQDSRIHDTAMDHGTAHNLYRAARNFSKPRQEARLGLGLRCDPALEGLRHARAPGDIGKPRRGDRPEIRYRRAR